MFLKLRIVFTILSAVCIAAVIPVGAFLGWVWAGVCGVGACLFFVLMRICKTQQELRETPKSERSDNEPDFLHPAEKANDEPKKEE